MFTDDSAAPPPTKQAVTLSIHATWPLSPIISSLPNWLGALKTTGVGGRPPRSGGRVPLKPLKTNTDRISARHPPANWNAPTPTKSQSSHLDIKLAPKPLKTFTKKIFNRHTSALCARRASLQGGVSTAAKGGSNQIRTFCSALSAQSLFPPRVSSFNFRVSKFGAWVAGHRSRVAESVLTLFNLT